MPQSESLVQMVTRDTESFLSTALEGHVYPQDELDDLFGAPVAVLVESQSMSDELEAHSSSPIKVIREEPDQSLSQLFCTTVTVLCDPVSQGETLIEPPAETPSLSFRDQMIKRMTDDSARIMETYAGAVKAHMLVCDGADGGHAQFSGMTAQRWIEAYDTTRAALEQVIDTDPDLADALAQDTLSDTQKETLRETAMKTYTNTVSIATKTDMSQLIEKVTGNMTNMNQALLMAQSAVSHVGCACHTGPESFMASPSFSAPGFAGMPVTALADNHDHEHKHSVQYCACGWKGETCTSEKCPRCKSKSWMDAAAYKRHKRKKEAESEE